MFATYIDRWALVPDGAPIERRSGSLIPVRYNGEPAILKVARELEERRGATIMEWWGGDGAARVLARDGDALLLERATGSRSLSDMARAGEADDNEAARILVDVAHRLHALRATPPPPELTSLEDWFRELWPAAEARGGLLARSAATARELLAAPRDIVVLHGDLHHDNVLDFGKRGWLAIDPKRLAGERGFDFANIFTNPDLEDPSRPVGIEPRRFLRRLEIVAGAAQLERRRLLQWILAWTGLSAAWYLSDGDPAEVDLQVAALAAAELDR
jgi:streptomycin 6-kinase